MDTLVEVSILVDADVAAELDNVRKREAVGRMVSRMLRPKKDCDPLLAVMDRISAEAKQRGMTQEILDEELAAYNSERRNERTPHS